MPLVTTGPRFAQVVPSGYSYRYFKWSITAVKTSLPIQVSSFRMQTAAGDMLASTVTGNYDSGDPPDRLNDTDYTSGTGNWKRQSLNDFVVFDMGTVIDAVGYRWATCGSNTSDTTGDPTAWTLHGSLDGANWFLLDTVSGFSATATRSAFATPVYVPAFAFGAQTRVLYDTFTCASDQYLTAHTPETGAWTGVSADWLCDAATDLLYYSSNNFGRFKAMFDAGSANQCIKIGSIGLGASTDRQHGPMLRCDSPVSPANFLQVLVDDTVVRLVKVISGTETSLATWTHGLTIPYTITGLECKIVGDTVTVDIGGENKIVYTLTSSEKAVLGLFTYVGLSTKQRGHWSTTTFVNDFDVYTWPTVVGGGNEIVSGDYHYHIFTTSGKLSVGSGAKLVEYLVVAGGASGGGTDNGSGGGGAGGVLSGSVVLTTSQTITVGAGGAQQTDRAANGIAGGNSSLGSIAVATGGGGGGAGQFATAGSTGGSGGGGSGGQAGGAGIAGQGNAGGTGGGTNLGGGGGGAYAAGSPADNTGGIGGAGGNGVEWPIGSGNYYGGGSGSGGVNAYSSGALGGGGIGGTYLTSGGDAAPNTGGGGGGGGGSSNHSGAGGSGIVIVRYRTAVAASGGTETIAAGYKYHTFTANGTLAVANGGPMEYIVVAGGGGAGGNANPYNGGGGAGGAIVRSEVVGPGTYPAVVGAGGAANNNGVNSTWNGLTAIGGGRGGTTFGTKGDGGSGGGGYIGNPDPGGLGTPGQGNNGGVGQNGGSSTPGAGGGAGAAGANGQPTHDGAAGGIGIQWPAGSGTYYAGGGGGGVEATGSFNGGVGGLGGGGRGHGLDGIDTAGTANTGGGAGGGANSRSGGSGIVIVRYRYPLFNFVSLGNLILWLDPSDAATITQSGGFVDQINDKSGNGNNFTQTSTARPGYGTAKINGRDALDFDGSNDYMAGPLLSSITDNFSMYVVVRPDASQASATALFHNGAGNSNGYGLSLSTNVSKVGFLRGGVAWHDSTTAAPSSGVHLLSLIRPSGTWSMRYDTTELVNVVGSNPNTPTGGSAIGSHDSGGHVMNGQMGEALFFSVAHGTADRQYVEACYRQKWGTL